jgi:hypothetical protein
LYKGVKEYKKIYQPRNEIVKDEDSEMLADSHNILNKKESYFSKLRM